MTAGAPAVDPLRHGLRRATSPFQGELLVETAGSLQRGSVIALSVTCGDSSPKGRALGKTRSFAVLPKPLPSGEVDLRSKDGEGEDAIH